MFAGYTECHALRRPRLAQTVGCCREKRNGRDAASLSVLGRDGVRLSISAGDIEARRLAVAFRHSVARFVLRYTGFRLTLRSQTPHRAKTPSPQKTASELGSGAASKLPGGDPSRFCCAIPP